MRVEAQVRLRTGHLEDDTARTHTECLRIDATAEIAQLRGAAAAHHFPRLCRLGGVRFKSTCELQRAVAADLLKGGDHLRSGDRGHAAEQHRRQRGIVADGAGDGVVPKAIGLRFGLGLADGGHQLYTARQGPSERGARNTPRHSFWKAGVGGRNFDRLPRPQR